jgi:hypothetical protein
MRGDFRADENMIGDLGMYDRYEIMDSLSFQISMMSLYYCASCFQEISLTFSLS